MNILVSLNNDNMVDTVWLIHFTYLINLSMINLNTFIVC